MDAKKDKIETLHKFNTVLLTILTSVIGYMMFQIDQIKAYQPMVIERVVKIEMKQENAEKSCAEFREAVNDRFLKMEAYIREEEKQFKTEK